jgi:hypothetical protein
LASKIINQRQKIEDVIQAVSFALYLTCKFLFLKHLGFLDFPMTIGGNFSPVELQANITVTRSFENFVPLQVSFLKIKDL